MPLTKIGLNLSGLDNVTAPTFDIKNTSQEFLNDIPTKANEVSGGWWGIIALGGLFAFLLWKLNQALADGGDYGYPMIRSIGIASCICAIVGLYGLNLGYFVNYYHVVIFIVGAFFSTVVVKLNQK